MIPSLIDNNAGLFSHICFRVTQIKRKLSKKSIYVTYVLSSYCCPTKHYIIQYISDMTKLSFKSQLEFSLDSIWWIQRIQNTLILYTLSLLIIYAFFPLISQRDMFSTNRLKNISQCDIKSILLATDKNNSISLNIWTKHYHQYHYQFVLSVILAIMSVSTFIPVVILYLSVRKSQRWITATIYL